MKPCPFCAERIQDEAIRCRFCGSMLDGSRPPGVDPVDEEVRHLLAARRKIDAIKLVRERKGLGLAEAKQYVESLGGAGETGAQAIRPRGCLGVLALGLALAALALAAATGAAPAGEPPCEPDVVVHGTVRFVRVEGGCWKLDGDDGRSYQLLTSDRAVLQDGLRGTLHGDVLEDVVTTCQVGAPTRVCKFVPDADVPDGPDPDQEERSRG